MFSIIRDGDTFHGISVFGRGVFTNNRNGIVTYAGQHRDGYACGLAVATRSSGTKEYAEHGPDGQLDGRNVDRHASGSTDYRLYERGKDKAYAGVSATGRCIYNYYQCAPDDPRLLALIAQVAPVEVRPAAPAPLPRIAPHSALSNRPMDRPARFAPAGARHRRGHRGAPPTPHTVAGGCAAQPNSYHTAKHVHTVTRARAVLRYWSHGRHPSVHTNGPVQAASVLCHSPAHRRTERWHLGRAVCLRARLPNAAILFSPGALLAGLCSFGYPVRFGRRRKPWPTCRCAWRCACTAATKFGGVL